jgi:RNA polymerase sigma factor (sigma-70 family)
MNAGAGAQRLPLICAKAEVSNETQHGPEGVRARTRAMVRGDEAAWVSFHRDYNGRIHRYLLVLLKGNDEVASEVLQITFTRLARHMREFHEEAVMWSWITRLARTALIDELRKRGRREESLRELAEEPAAEQLERTDWSELLQQALAQIETPERELLQRKYVQGQSVREIASGGMDSEKAVESRITRARAKLRAAMLRLLQREE